MAMKTITEQVEPEVLYYDGHCGLCDATVRFVLRNDEGGRAFRFAPLGGSTFERALPEAERARLPDSLVLVTGDGRTLTRSTGVVRLLRRLGGVWSVLGALLWIVPRPVRNLGYDVVARLRHRLFPPPEACPILPPEPRSRFLP